MNIGQILLDTHYEFECIKADGQVRWQDGFDNLVTIAGLTDAIDKHFKASGYTSAWYVGLLSGTVSLTDNMASHAGWSEIVAYSDANRPTLTLGAISSGIANNSASKASFSISSQATVGGAFLTTYQTKNISSGTLYGGGTFAGGNRAVSSGDTLNVTVTVSASN